MYDSAAQDDLPALDEGSFQRITELVFRHTGIRLGPRKAYFVVGRLGGLYRRLGCCHWGELPLLFEERGEADLREALVQAVVTPETRFFRDESPFRALREEIVPRLAAGLPAPMPVRVWSAGCSTGQEPYSAVMALWDLVEQGLVDLEVWATDISERALDHAREGLYEPHELRRGLDPEARRRFFEEVGDGRARVRSALRGRVRFDRLNLAADRPVEAGFHVVFCRNVGIYFDRAGKERLYRTMGRSVRVGGYLVLGAAETVFPGVPGFETVYFGRSLLYRKRTGGPP